MSNPFSPARRQPWSADELQLLKRGASWGEFHEAFPDRSYDSWEVKRRRVGGSAGQSRRYGKRQADQLAEKILLILEEYIEGRRGG